MDAPELVSIEDYDIHKVDDCAACLSVFYGFFVLLLHKFDWRHLYLEMDSMASCCYF